jgi:hypothetical protein
LVLPVAAIPYVEELPNGNQPGQLPEKAKKKRGSAPTVAADIQDLDPVVSD